MYGIFVENLFLFVIKFGKLYCFGWYVLKNVCSRVDVSMIINVGKMRYRLFIIYVSLYMLL